MVEPGIQSWLLPVTQVQGTLQSLVSVQVTKIIMTPATAQFSVSSVATRGGPEPVYPSLCPLVTTWAVNIIEFDCRRDTDPDVVFRSSLSPYVTIALDGK